MRSKLITGSLLLTVLSITACSVSKTAMNSKEHVDDDIYYTKTEVPEEPVKQSQSVANAPEQEAYDNSTQEEEGTYTDDEGYNGDGVEQDSYAARIDRFYYPNTINNYYSPFFSPSFYDPFNDPYYYGYRSGIGLSLGFGPGLFNRGFGFGYNPWGWGGYNSFNSFSTFYPGLYSPFYGGGYGYGGRYNYANARPSVNTNYNRPRARVGSENVSGTTNRPTTISRGSDGRINSTATGRPRPSSTGTVNERNKPVQRAQPESRPRATESRPRTQSPPRESVRPRPESRPQSQPVRTESSGGSNRGSSGGSSGGGGGSRPRP